MLSSNSLKMDIIKFIAYSGLVCILALSLFISNSVFASSNYIPNSPSGPNNGDINEEMQFTLPSIEIGSSWMFDWGDGNYSDWIEIDQSETPITHNYSWVSYGEYTVKVKKKDQYGTESYWSTPLVVSIVEQTTSDYQTSTDDSQKTNNQDIPVSNEDSHVSKNSFKIPWLYIIPTIVIVILIIIYFLFKRGIIYLYEEEYVTED